MEKLAYVIRQSDGVSGASLRDALIEKSAPRLRDAGAIHVQVNVNDEDVAQGEAIRIRMIEPPMRAMVTFWMEDADEREGCEAVLGEHALELHGWLVVESVPILNRTQLVPHGERTPGVSTIGLVTRRADVSYEKFIETWHGLHRRVAIETQSTFGYVRNEIVRSLTPGNPRFTALVEENFPIEALTDPWVFYDYARNDQEYQERLARMMDSCQRFLDLEYMESHPTSEYVLG